MQPGIIRKSLILFFLQTCFFLGENLLLFFLVELEIKWRSPNKK